MRGAILPVGLRRRLSLLLELCLLLMLRLGYRLVTCLRVSVAIGYAWSFILWRRALSLILMISRLRSMVSTRGILPRVTLARALWDVWHGVRLFKCLLLFLDRFRLLLLLRLLLGLALALR